MTTLLSSVGTGKGGFKFVPKEKTWLVDRQKALSLLPFLRWIEESAPYVGYRRAAKSLIGKMEDVRDREWKQVLITKQEEDALRAVYEALPYRELKEPEQLRLDM